MAADSLLGDYHAPASPPSASGPVDLVFAIDTTGSMGDDIDSVKAQTSTILSLLKGSSSSARAGLVLYKDEGDVYVTKVASPLTTDLDSVNSAIQSITVDGGGDTPEAVNSGLIAAIGEDWRPGVKKAVILLGDAPGHNPEPGSGYTIADVGVAAEAVDPAIVFPIATAPDPDAIAYFKQLADVTGGTQFTVSDGDVAAAVTKAITEITAAPTAALAIDAAPVGGTTTFSAVDSTPGGAAIAKYQWDLDGDGNYEAESASAVVTKIFDAPFTGTVAVRVVDENGRTGVATSHLEVSALAAPVEMPPVDGLQVTRDACGAVLRWVAPTLPSDKRANYVITDSSGRTVGDVEDGSTAWRVPDGSLDPGTLRVFVDVVDSGTETAPNDVRCTSSPSVSSPHEPAPSGSEPSALTQIGRPPSTVGSNVTPAVVVSPRFTG
jgi:hypothetical protein